MTESIAYLDGERLQRCLLAGLDRLISERDYLNSINVFPVPDGDTGNNLARTALAAREAIAKAPASAGAVLTNLADGALDGAQGNSGAILAQFFQSLAGELSNKSRIDTFDLAQAMPVAAADTRGALTDPREGTILTVLDAVAEAARRNRRTKDFAKLLPAMLEAARQALGATTEQLDELRRANVVDAGAKGLVAILEGCTDFLLHGSLRNATPPAEETLDAIAQHYDHTDHLTDLRYRYCTECTVTGTGLDRALIRQQLEPLGNSLVIAGSPRRMRIHIHTNEPESVFELAGELGTVAHTKADDMIGQARSLNRDNREVVIMTDSAADIPDEMLEAHDIHMVPLRVQFGTKSHLDKYGMTPAEFRRELQTNPNPPGTSQPTQGDLRRMYEFLGTHFREIVYVTVSSALSGTWQAARAAAERTDARGRINIIDSRNVSVGQGLVTLQAARLAEQGLQGTALVRSIEALTAEVATYALVFDLSNAVRSGRVKPGFKRLADWLRLIPILGRTPAGSVGLSGVLFGRHRLIERFAAHIARRHKKAGTLEFAIAHGHNEAGLADQLTEVLQQRLGEASCTWQTEIGAALGVHAGMQALVVAVAPKV